MDAKANKNLHRLERKAIQEAEKRKKPGECMKVIKINIKFRFDYLIIFDLYLSMFKLSLMKTFQMNRLDQRFWQLQILLANS